MKTLDRRSVRCLLLFIGCIAAFGPVRARPAGTSVNSELLQSRIAVARESAELDDATRSRLIDLYRQSLGNLEAIQANEAAAAEYRREGREAPGETEGIRERLERRRATDPTAELRDLSGSSTARLTRLLNEETANLTAVEAKLAILEAQFETAALEPANVRARIAAARSQVEALAAETADRRAAGGAPQIAEAARWAAETRVEALRTEISMLDQELLSHAQRTELLRARRADATLDVDRMHRRIEILRGAVGERRHEEVRVATAQARAALAGASSEARLVRELAEANLSTVELLQRQLAELDDLAEKENRRPRTAEIDNAFRSARRKLELEGSVAPVGLAIERERRRFAAAREYEMERRSVSRSIVGVSLRLLEAEEERTSLGDIDSYLDRATAEAGEGRLDATDRAELERLATTRRDLLDLSISNDVILQRRLLDLEDALRRVAERLNAYDEFLAGRLLWVRSKPPLELPSFARLPAQLKRYLRPGPWLGVGREAGRQLLRSPILLFLVVLAVALAAARRWIRDAVLACGRQVGVVLQDGLGSTIRALAFTLLLSAPVPLVLFALGGALVRAPDAEPFAVGVGEALLKLATWIALPVVVRALFLPGGVANRHFGWTNAMATLLRRQLTWFMWVLFPSYLVLSTSLVLEPPAKTGGELTFLCFVTINGVLIALVRGTLHPTHGSLWQVVTFESSAARWQWRYLLFPIVVLLPVGMILLGWLGYFYSAQQVMRRLFLSIWYLVAIWVGAALVRRWLLVTARRLAAKKPTGPLDAASEQEPSGPGSLDSESDRADVDLVALGADSRQLLNAVVVLVVVVTLAAIWGGMFPALGVLERIQLWSHSELVDGVQQPVPVGLLDVLLAAVVAIVGYLLAKNLPSLLDIILLKQGRISAGGRYTAGTLTRYAVTATTALVVLHLLGASASQLGWAAAALGVGIGFGLQEIVANFICGLILLFERPVRVGDVITIGDASGFVTRIRIRATTIRDWEEKELVVPNKELITGRLLNWTLSDSVIRVFVAVGIAYGSDTDKAMALIREAAIEHPLVLADPEPRVHFEQFGDSSLNLTLRAFTADVTNRLSVNTELHQAIDRKFRAAGIVIAFPQRDVHLHSSAPPSRE